MQKFLRVAAMAAGVFLLAVFSAISVFLNTACDGGLYYEIQQDLSVECGVDDETLMELDLILGRYLAGNADALEETELFNADEKAHMVDVYNIFSVLRLIKNGAFAAALIILVAVYYNRAKFTRAQLRTGVISGVMLLIVPLGAVGIWAAVDFEAAFLTMHKLLFSNELWLMDPRTDLMIRMLPGEFFMTIGLKLAVRSGIAAILPPALIFAGTVDWKKFKKPAADE